MRAAPLWCAAKTQTQKLKPFAKGITPWSQNKPHRLKLGALFA
jgi:hypothetical protein